MNQPGICLDGLRLTTEHLSEGNRFPDLHPNSAPPEVERYPYRNLLDRSPVRQMYIPLTTRGSRRHADQRLPRGEGCCLSVELMDDYRQERQTILILGAEWKHQAVQAAVQWEVHFANAFRMGSHSPRNLAHAPPIAFLAVKVSWAWNSCE